jgi:hypothetical protein
MVCYEHSNARDMRSPDNRRDDYLEASAHPPRHRTADWPQTRVRFDVEAVAILE